jgi:hypothetical protein
MPAVTAPTSRFKYILAHATAITEGMTAAEKSAFFAAHNAADRKPR